jgi:hypothetical protein
LGADNKLVCFVHPKSANGVLIELCQEVAVWIRIYRIWEFIELKSMFYKYLSSIRYVAIGILLILKFCKFWFRHYFYFCYSELHFYYYICTSFK